MVVTLVLALVWVALSVASLASAQVAAAPPVASAAVDDQVMAWVGQEPIFASEILARVDQVMEEHRGEIPAERWNEQRVALAQQALKAAVETKLVLVDAYRKIPAAGQAELRKRVDEQFEAEQLPRLLKNMQVESRAGLEQKLLAGGSSLEQQRRSYFESSLSYQWRQSMTTVEKQVSHNDMLEYYQSHLKNYERPARVRWEQLSAHIDRYPSKAAAYAQLAEMGNDVLRGVPWAQVARASHGATAKEGGQRDWTTQGSLTSKVLDQALFSLPPGVPSPILEDDRGFHIIRVVEREVAGRTSFRDAQVKIKEEIEQQRREKAIQDYYAKLRKETLVWTVFGDAETTQRFAQSIAIGTTRR